MILLFWILIAVMTAVAAGFVLLPLLRPAASAGIRRRDVNVAIYRERLEELERQREHMGESEARAAREESERRLLDDAGEDERRTPSAQPSLAWALALALALPVLAIGFYLGNSDWRLALTRGNTEMAQLLLGRLELHLAKNPADAAGWQLLGQSRLRLGDYAGSAEAYARAQELAPSADTLAGQAEALALAAGGSMQGRPAVLVEEALRLDPGHPRALWYAGLAASQRGDANGAVKHWNRLAAQSLPPEFRKLLETAIVSAGGTPVAEASPLTLAVNVKLDPSLGKVPADAAVFIYARPRGEKSGPPLAAVRRRVADLPLQLNLSDADSMLPTRKLSSVEAWTVSARVALQGSAEARPGDLFAESDVSVAERNKPLNLLIKARIP